MPHLGDDDFGSDDVSEDGREEQQHLAVYGGIHRYESDDEKGPEDYSALVERNEHPSRFFNVDSESSRLDDTMGRFEQMLVNLEDRL